MSVNVWNKFQPIWGAVQLVAVGTASATTSSTLPACGAVRIISGGAPLFFSFTASASSGAATANKSIQMPANSVIDFETAGSHSISLKVDASANPMSISIVPLV